MHHSRLGEWNRPKDFWEFTEPLAKVEGRISKYYGPEAAEIEVPGGLRAFFVPGKHGFVDKDINSVVSFFLGFSYDGLRAWNVRSLEHSAGETQQMA